MIMGLAIYTPLAMAGAIFYIVHHILVKANLFLIGGFVERKYGTSQLKQLGEYIKQCLGWPCYFLLQHSL